MPKLQELLGASQKLHTTSGVHAPKPLLRTAQSSTPTPICPAPKTNPSSTMAVMEITGAASLTLAPVHHFLPSKKFFLGLDHNQKTGSIFRYGQHQPFHLNVTLKPSSKSRILPPIRAQTIPDYVPASKFYKVEAILRPWRVPKVSSALIKMGIRGVTVSDVRGFGAQGGSTERHAGSEFSEDKFVSKIKMEIVVSHDQVEEVIDVIIQEARTGEIGDGKIFVLPVADIIRVRTGERGEQAERMSGGRHEMSNGTSTR